MKTLRVASTLTPPPQHTMEKLEYLFEKIKLGLGYLKTFQLDFKLDFKNLKSIFDLIKLKSSTKRLKFKTNSLSQMKILD